MLLVVCFDNGEGDVKVKIIQRVDRLVVYEAVQGFGVKFAVKNLERVRWQWYYFKMICSIYDE